METAAASSPTTSTTTNTPADSGTQDTSQERGSPGTPSRESTKPQATKPDSKGPAQAAKPEFFDVKVDGKVIKMSREEAIQYASMGHAAQKRFQEAAQLRKQAESVIGKMRDPKQVISALQDPALGLKKEQIREAFEEWYAKEFIEPEQLSPEQKKIRDYEEKLKKYADAEKEREEQKQKDQQEAMTAEAREHVQKQILEALETSTLPKTNFTIKRLAYWMQRNHANGFNAPTEVLVGQVKNEINSFIRDMVEPSDGEVLIKLLGDGVITKLRKYDLEQLRRLRGGGGQQVQTDEPTPASDSQSARNLTSSEVQDRIREMQRTGKY